MTQELELFERPAAEEMYMIAGWRQWADAGATSSGLLEWLIQHLSARKIGAIRSDGFFLFQTPVSQFLFRPVIKLEEGYRQQLIKPRSEIFYWGNNSKGLVLFLGDEPHLDVDRYARAFFEVARQLNVKRIAATGGVHAVVPYDKDRAITCSYSLPALKAELSEYAVQFSNYEGGASIGSYLNDQAEALGIEYFSWYAFVPAYPLSQLHPSLDNIVVEKDFKAWLDILVRLNRMFGLDIELSDLEEESDELTRALRAQIDALNAKLPHAPISPGEYIARMTAGFTEMSFNPKGDDIWEDALSDLFKDVE